MTVDSKVLNRPVVGCGLLDVSCRLREGREQYLVSEWRESGSTGPNYGECRMCAGPYLFWVGRELVSYLGVSSGD